MGGAVVKDEIYETMLDETDSPINCFMVTPILSSIVTTGLATLDIYKERNCLKEQLL